MSLDANPDTPWRATTTMEPTVHHVRRSAKQAPKPDADAPSVATGPHYHVIRAPLYVPPPQAAARAGADDFLQCKSLGTLC